MCGGKSLRMQATTCGLVVGENINNGAQKHQQQRTPMTARTTQQRFNFL